MEKEKEAIEESEQKQTLFEFPEEESAEELEKKKKREVLFEMALFLVLGILLGITMKTEAVKRITIGFNDYKIVNGRNAFNTSEMKKKLDEQAKAMQEAQSQAIQQQVQQQSNQ
jgi:predicted nucleic acid-binding Zn ribbon protein